MRAGRSSASWDGAASPVDSGVSRSSYVQPRPSRRPAMAHPVIHAEIRSTDPDKTREFFAALFGWTYSDGAFPGYTFADTGAGDGALPAAIGPLQGGTDSVLFFIGVDDVDAALAQAEKLGGAVVAPGHAVAWVSVGVFVLTLG